MQQIFLNHHSEQIPQFGQFSQILGATEKKDNVPVFLNKELKTPEKFHPYYDWEFFMSELEYE